MVDADRGKTGGLKIASGAGLERKKAVDVEGETALDL